MSSRHCLLELRWRAIQARDDIFSKDAYQQIFAGTRDLELQLVVVHVVEGRRRQELPGVATDRAVQGHPEQRVAEETRPEVFGVLLVAALLRQRFLPRPGGALRQKFILSWVGDGLAQRCCSSVSPCHTGFEWFQIQIFVRSNAREKVLLWQWMELEPPQK